MANRLMTFDGTVGQAINCETVEIADCRMLLSKMWLGWSTLSVRAWQFYNGGQFSQIRIAWNGWVWDGDYTGTSKKHQWPLCSFDWDGRIWLIGSSKIHFQRIFLASFRISPEHPRVLIIKRDLLQRPWHLLKKMYQQGFRWDEFFAKNSTPKANRTWNGMIATLEKMAAVEGKPHVLETTDLSWAFGDMGSSSFAMTTHNCHQWSWGAGNMLPTKWLNFAKLLASLWSSELQQVSGSKTRVVPGCGPLGGQLSEVA